MKRPETIAIVCAYRDILDCLESDHSTIQARKQTEANFLHMNSQNINRTKDFSIFCLHKIGRAHV